MDKAYCGLECTKCEAYLAYKNNDLQKKTDIAKLWSETYGYDLNPEDIICEGCSSDTRIGRCINCGIRDCCINKNIPACSDCEEFPCSEIKELMIIFPSVRNNLITCK